MPLSHRVSTIATLFYLPCQRRSWTRCSIFKMLRHVWSQGPGNMSVVCHGWCTTTWTGWLFLSGCSTSLLWQSIVVFSIKLQGTSSTTVCQSPKFLVTSIGSLPDVINCQFHEFTIALLAPMHSVSGPTVWKSLRDPAVDSEQFRRDLKTYLFARHAKL